MRKSLLWTIVGVVLVIVSIGILQLANFTPSWMIYVLLGSTLLFLVSLFIFALRTKKVWLKVLIIVAELAFVSWIVLGVALSPTIGALR